MAGGWLRCRVCRAETSLTAGTIFEGTRKPLRTWFLAMWFVTSQKNGVSALGLQRELGSAAMRRRGPGCEFRRNPAGDSDLKPATVPITQSGRGFRFEAGHRSDLIPATIPI